MTAYDPEAISALEAKARIVRKHIVRMTCAAGSGHPGGSLSAADILVALYFNIMKHDPENPCLSERDRFVASKGHCAPAVYATLAEAGYFPVSELANLRKLGGTLQGHPSMRRCLGIDMSTGSLGQGLSVGVGMALAAKLDRKPYRVFTLHGDGEMQSGNIWEGAMAAAHYKLDNITAFLDRNKLQIDGPTEQVMSIEPIGFKWKSFGWHVLEINGHSFAEIISAVDEAREFKGKPTMIIAHTVKGKGVSFMEGALAFHGMAPSKAQSEQALKELGGET
jgi:transketolase